MHCVAEGKQLIGRRCCCQCCLYSIHYSIWYSICLVSFSIHFHSFDHLFEQSIHFRYMSFSIQSNLISFIIFEVISTTVTCYSLVRRIYTAPAARLCILTRADHPASQGSDRHIRQQVNTNSCGSSHFVEYCIMC